MIVQDYLCSTSVLFWGELGNSCVEVKDRPRHAGTFNHTMLIFKEKRLMCQWFYGRPEKVAVGVCDGGWMNSDLFLERSQMFTEQLPRQMTQGLVSSSWTPCLQFGPYTTDAMTYPNMASSLLTRHFNKKVWTTVGGGGSHSLRGLHRLKMSRLDGLLRSVQPHSVTSQLRKNTLLGLEEENVSG